MSEETSNESAETGEGELREGSLRVVRVGHGANCSSVGSVVDTLFLGAVVGGAILAAVCAAMKVERITVVGEASRDEHDEHEDERDQEGEGT